MLRRDFLILVWLAFPFLAAGMVQPLLRKIGKGFSIVPGQAPFPSAEPKVTGFIFNHTPNYITGKISQTNKH